MKAKELSFASEDSAAMASECGSQLISASITTVLRPGLDSIGGSSREVDSVARSCP